MHFPFNLRSPTITARITKEGESRGCIERRKHGEYLTCAFLERLNQTLRPKEVTDSTELSTRCRYPKRNGSWNDCPATQIVDGGDRKLVRRRGSVAIGRGSRSGGIFRRLFR